MEWLNDGVGLIVLIASVVIVALLAVAISLLLILRSKIAVQRLKFLGSYSVDRETRVRYADCVIGNPSLNEVVLAEVGLRNGKVSFNLTDLYKRKEHLNEEARVVVEQRGSIRFTLGAEELKTVLADGKNGKVLHSLSLYAIDLTGTLYKGKVPEVTKLLGELLREEKSGVKPAEAPVEGAHVEEAPAETADASDTAVHVATDATERAVADDSAPAETPSSDVPPDGK